MISIELDMPEILVRKIKALSVLIGTSNIDDLIVDIMDKSVSEEIASILGIGVAAQPAKPEAPAPVPVRNQYAPSREITEVADGLGDEEESNPPPVEDVFAFVPKNGVSDKSLDEDMDVFDPEHEAKSEPPENSHAEYGRSGELFSNMMGLPAFDTPEEYEVDPRVSRRKRKLNIKGRVMPATSVQESF